MRGRTGTPTSARRRERQALPFRRLASAALLLAFPSGVFPSPALAAGKGSPARPLEAKLERLDGSKLRLSELRGQPVLLELWATWCLPCREQAAVVHDLAGELSDRGVRVLAVDEGERPKLVRKYLADHPSSSEVVLDPYQVVSGLLEVGKLPALALLDGDGKVIGVREGLMRGDGVLELLSALDGDTAPR